jgi:hypothetical protein
MKRGRKSAAWARGRIIPIRRLLRKQQCRPLTSEDREVCRDMAEGNPTIYQRCEARAMATSKEEINCIAALLERATKEHMSEEAIRRAVDSCASR